MTSTCDQTSGTRGSRGGIFARLSANVPPAQFSRYLLVGIWNTAFGYGTYAGFTALLTTHVAHAYIVASLFSNLLSITSAFLAYKWFVFKTRGHYLREWLRCVTVYGGSALIGTALLPVFVLVLRRFASVDSSAPYIAGAAVMGLTAFTSFLGHKNFSFAQSK